MSNGEMFSSTIFRRTAITAWAVRHQRQGRLLPGPRYRCSFGQIGFLSASQTISSRYVTFALAMRISILRLLPASSQIRLKSERILSRRFVYV